MVALAQVYQHNGVQMVYIYTISQCQCLYFYPIYMKVWSVFTDPLTTSSIIFSKKKFITASRTAGWSNVESWTAHFGQHHIYFGPLFVPATNFGGPLDGQSDINIRTACQGYIHIGSSQGF